MLAGICFLLATAPHMTFALAPKSEAPYFEKFYSPGPAQQLLIAQSTPQAAPSEGLNLDAPSIDAKKDEGANLGPLSNINFGGALDMRLYLPKPGGPTDAHLGMGYFDIHVSELFLTTNIGDHISVLAEQLLVTSPMGNTIGQDHGFVYAIFSSIPGLPENMAIKVGRTRFKFGIDARLDSPANPLRSPVYQTLGTITDKGIELSGYTGFLEWSLGVANGVDSVDREVMSMNGEEAMVATDVRNGSKPVYARLSAEPVDGVSFGLSGFTGKTYPVYSHYGFAMHDMIFNGHTDNSRLIYKNRGAVDGKFKLSSRWDLSAEYAFGTDRDEGQSYSIRNYYTRLDYRIIPQKFTVQLQYNYFDDGRDISIIEGRPYKDSGVFGFGLTWYVTDQSWIRATYLMDDRGIFRSKDGDTKAPEYLGVIQTLLAF
ncbi:MAG: hypothetical protein JST16_14625 [Bdellovibrionales bacterium]|nr:hypothetical protein [Bdellovibrionales bacterium]